MITSEKHVRVRSRFSPPVIDLSRSKSSLADSARRAGSRGTGSAFSRRM